MATPYPMNPQMGDGSGGPPPVAPTPSPRVIRKGTSKVVPVVISAGLAAGVFCGLLFGVGVNRGTAVAAVPSTGNNLKHLKHDPADDVTAPATTAPVAPAPVPVPVPVPPTPPAAGSGSGSGSAVAAGSGSGSGSAVAAGSGSAVAAGSGSGSAVVAETHTLTITVKPDKPNTTITVDGTAMTNGSMPIDLAGKDEKIVSVVVKVPGYAEQKRDVQVKGDTTDAEFDFSKQSPLATNTHTTTTTTTTSTHTSGSSGTHSSSSSTTTSTHTHSNNPPPKKTNQIDL